MSAGIKGVSAGQDARYINKEKKLMRTMKFPKEYELKVNLKLVNWEIMKVWIAQRITELLGIEDDVLIGYVFEQLDPSVHQTVDPRQLQIALTGFLEKNTSLFCKELWVMLHSAAGNASGIPQPILDAKAEEVRQRELVQKELEVRLKEAAAKREAEDREARKAAAEADREARKRQHEADSEARRGSDKGRETPRSHQRNSDRRRSPDHRMGRNNGREHDRRHDRKRSHSPAHEADRRRRQWRSHSASPQQQLPPPPVHAAAKEEVPTLTQQPSAARGAETRGEQAARGSGADGGTPTEEERARRHREKKEKKERKAHKKEKKRLKKEGHHKGEGPSGREGSPSSGSEPETREDRPNVKEKQAEGGSPTAKRRLLSLSYWKN